MKKTILFAAITLLLTQQPAYADSSKQVIKNASPNQYDCSIDELELYIAKRTEDLRRDTGLSNWEDFKTQLAKAKMTGDNATNSSETGGNASSEAKARYNAKKGLSSTGGASGKEEDDCPLFFSDLQDIELPTDGLDFDSIIGAIGGGLDGLQDLAKDQMNKLSETLMSTIKKGVCKRLSTDYITDLGKDYLDDKLKENIGYTTNDITGGNFANEVLNDGLREEYGTSNAKLLNILDPNLERKRDSFINRQVNSKLNDIEDQILN